VRVNDEAIEIAGANSRGYLRLVRLWRPGDQVQLDLQMPVERVYAHPLVRQDAGLVALQRGPLVYCLEGVDNPVELDRLALPVHAPLGAETAPDLLEGLVRVTATAQATEDGDGSALYRTTPPANAPVPIAAVPYYAWDNREPGQMAVWIREAGG
jgi:DUF1680 family protein